MGYGHRTYARRATVSIVAELKNEEPKNAPS